MARGAVLWPEFSVALENAYLSHSVRPGTRGFGTLNRARRPHTEGSPQGLCALLQQWLSLNSQFPYV